AGNLRRSRLELLRTAAIQKVQVTMLPHRGCMARRQTMDNRHLWLDVGWTGFNGVLGFRIIFRLPWCPRVPPVVHCTSVGGPSAARAFS
ncbi:MAG TPA: hypothetical protein VIV66_21975, partial [Pyrinomonadaceae bacterium]